MFYTNELAFLREVFQKSHVHTIVSRPNEFEALFREIPINALIDRSSFFTEAGRAFSPRTLYHLTDLSDCSYRALLLPDSGGQRVLWIGPYLKKQISAQRLPEIGEQIGLPPQKQSRLAGYYAGIPVLDEDCPLWLMLNCFCERLWQSQSFPVKDVLQSAAPNAAPISKSMQSAELDDSLANIKAMEERYAFENEMIRAVELGQTHKTPLLLSAFSAEFFEKRAADPLRNVKNYGIIMNTLLRKAAEHGGVHPIYLDQISSGFAVKIENLARPSDNLALMREMFDTYCRLVQKHALQGFSSVVQKTILLIDADLSANLTAGTLAEQQKVSLGYLSAVFRKETGRTVSTYIRERRMEYASYLLSSTDLQIQTVALHCGIMDVQYISKLFKRQFGKSPTEYRQEIKKGEK